MTKVSISVEEDLKELFKYSALKREIKQSELFQELINSMKNKVNKNEIKAMKEAEAKEEEEKKEAKRIASEERYNKVKEQKRIAMAKAQKLDTKLKGAIKIVDIDSPKYLSKIAKEKEEAREKLELEALEATNNI